MSGKARFEKLLSPYHIGRVKTRNRIVKAPQGMYSASRDGYVTDTKIGIYEAQAKGGVGLLMIPWAFPDSRGLAYAVNELLIDDDKFIPGLSQLVQAIHQYGCPTFLQLVHAGPYQSIPGLQPLAASTLSDSENPLSEFGAAKELTIPEIEAIVDKFAKGAERAQKADFDGVELHACHTDLINTFLSRTWNKRKDAYGCQDLKSRARFMVEIVQAIKERAGQDFPVCVRINGVEYGQGEGITSEESQGFAQILQEAGADAIHVTGYGYGDYATLMLPELVFYPEPPKPLAERLNQKDKGVLVPAAAAIKRVVSIPVIAANWLDPFIGEKILREGKADFIALGRRLLADPELPNKIASGRLEDIAPCTACLGCIERIYVTHEPVTCRVNAALGKEREYEIKAVKKKKRVMVVGGGPAGLEAARVAALRGHEVVLYERERSLGGATRLAGLVKGLEIEDLVGLIGYLKTQIGKLGVRVRLGKEVNLAVVEEIKPDVVILATGGIPADPEVAGINRGNVVSTPDIYRMVRTYLRFFGPRGLRWLTRFWMPVGKRVVIIGGGIQGCELAEFLVKRGRKVTIVEASDELGTEMASYHKIALLRWLTKKGAVWFTGVKYEEITDKGLTIITKEGERRTIEADTIVPAIPLRPNTELFQALEGKVPEIYPIGDCREPHLILEAIADGSRIGRAI